MAYIRREKYTVIDDNDIKKEMLDTLLEKGIQSTKAKQLVYYPVPMSLIRWAKWLEPAECDMFLEPYYEDAENQDDFGF